MNFHRGSTRTHAEASVSGRSERECKLELTHIRVNEVIISAVMKLSVDSLISRRETSGEFYQAWIIFNLQVSSLSANVKITFTSVTLASPSLFVHL